jgi:hypothetical protein
LTKPKIKAGSFFSQFELPLLLIITLAAATTLAGYSATTPKNPHAAQYQTNGNLNAIGITIQGDEVQNQTINWGPLTPGESKNVSFTVQSQSNMPIMLGHNESRWNPPGIGNYLKLSWNYTDQPLQSGQEISLTVTLTAPLTDEFEYYLIENRVNSFSFDLTIYSVAT